MKSKSPFAIKSPLLAYKSDMKGNYANPEYVPETIVGAEIGANIAKTAASVFESYAASKKGESGDDGSKKEFDFKGKPFGDMSVSAGPYEHEFSSKSSNTTSMGGGKLASYDKAWKTDLEGIQGMYKNKQAYIDDVSGQGETEEKANARQFSKDYLAKGNTYDKSKHEKLMIASMTQMKGSPVKHNAGAVGSIGNADPLAGGIAGIGQQISNQAQQRAVDAGGSTGVDPFLPPPNQVAETGSYGSGGDRDMLEMNGNQINNQSIGRNTDITSQLFGSGQRASMLAMKGTPLHTEGHGGAKDHKHSPESRNPATPKYINGVDPYETADKSISSTDEPRRLEEGEIGAPTEREQSDRDYLAEFDMEYKASGGNLYVPKKR
jgi:hypothetical protein